MLGSSCQGLELRREDGGAGVRETKSVCKRKMKFFVLEKKKRKSGGIVKI